MRSTRRVLLAPAAAMALTLLAGCSSTPTFKSDDGAFELEVSQLKKTKLPGEGDVCIIGFQATNRSTTEIQPDEIYVEPSTSRYYDISDFVVLDEQDDGSFTYKGWPFNFVISDVNGEVTENADSFGSGESVKWADLYPCEDLGTDYAIGTAQGRISNELLSFSIPTWQAD